MALLAPMLWKVAKTDEIGGVRLHLVHPEEDAQFGFSVLTNGDHSRIMRLILAAPELLEALKRIAFEPIGHPEASHQEVLDGVVHIARAAVAKAEGRTNG